MTISEIKFKGKHENYSIFIGKNALSILTKKLSPKAIKNFDSDPILVAAFLFSENGFFSLSTSTLEKYEKNIYKDGSYVVDPNFKGYTNKTCGDDYDPEEDYEGKCKILNF